MRRALGALAGARSRSLLGGRAGGRAAAAAVAAARARGAGGAARSGRAPPTGAVRRAWSAGGACQVSTGVAHSARGARHGAQLRRAACAASVSADGGSARGAGVNMNGAGTASPRAPGASVAQENTQERQRPQEQQEGGKKSRKRRRRPAGENFGVLVKRRDSAAAVALFDSRRAAGEAIAMHELDALLFLLRTEAVGDAATDISAAAAAAAAAKDKADAEEFVGSTIGQDAAQERVMEVFDFMSTISTPTEPAYTAAASVAVTRGDLKRAVALLREMADARVVAKHRSYSTTLDALADEGEYDEAVALVEHMASSAVEELPATGFELCALLRAAAGANRTAAMRPLLDRLLNDVSMLTPPQGEALARWFRESAPHPRHLAPAESEAAPPASQRQEDGGAAGASAGWRVSEDVELSAEGKCPFSGTQLEAKFLSDAEYAEFSTRVEALAEKRASNPEQLAALKQFLEHHGPFDIIIDGANVALFNQNFAGGGFNCRQIENLVAETAKQIPSARQPPLVILHESRVSTAMRTEEGRRVLGKLKKQGSLFATPRGANDDWYWLYAAAIRGESGLLVSNDQMRDHLFQMLRPREFLRYRARHQVKYDFDGKNTKDNRLGCNLHNPKPYTECMQVARDGATWHVPVCNEEDGSVRWVCAWHAADEAAG